MSPKRRGVPASSAKHLVIVESPAKARAIGKYLGSSYVVAASVGHVRDLPARELGVDPARGFEPTYEISRGKKKILDDLRRAAKDAERVYVATDPDREGEAIGWHIVDELGLSLDTVHRALFFEISPAAVKKAIAESGQIDGRKVDAQQARRILDRLVGYKISPLLSEPFYPGLSAGRVQTVALRMVCEREDAIEAFQRVAYWKVTATVAAGGAGDIEAEPFPAELHRVGRVAVVPRGQPGAPGYRPPALVSEAAAQAVVDRARAAEWAVTALEKVERQRTAPPPFTTSTLQQEAARRLGMSAKRTMALAQRLYEGVEIDGEPIGLITYMRTDATRVAESALTAVRAMIGKRFGAAFRPAKPNRYRSGAGAQEAHEAVRPTDADRSLDVIRRALSRANDGRDLLRLYELIWLRFVASQMTPARYDRTTVTFLVDGDLEFRTSGSVLTFAGFLEAYRMAGRPAEAGDDVLLPALTEAQAVTPREVTHDARETQPPARYSEATLVKELEAQGIGRPSTYATIVSRIFERKYVEREAKQIKPTVLGRFVIKYLMHHFADIFEIGFTREMEAELDRIEEGERPWREVVGELWNPLDEDVRRVEGLGTDVDGRDWTEMEAPPCPADPAHGPMRLKWNRFGAFWGCQQYPACKKTARIPHLGPQAPTVPCPLDGGELVVKQSRRGPFVGCANYPACEFTMNLGDDPAAAMAARERSQEAERALDRTCPDCGGVLGVKTGRYGAFIGCKNYPKCKHTEPLPSGVTCPQCGTGDLVERRTGRGRGGRRFYGCNRYPECDYTQQGAPRVGPCPECGHAVLERARVEGEERLRCPQCKAEVPEPAEVAS